MKALLISAVLGAMVMVSAGTQAASAAAWRPAYRGGHVYGHTPYRTAYVRPHSYGRYAGPARGYNRCW